MDSLKKFEEKNQQTLAKTIGSRVGMGLDELAHTMGFGKKSTDAVANKDNRIDGSLERYEKKIIQSRKPKS